MKQPTISTWDDLFAYIGDGPSEIGRVLGVPRQTAFAMMQRKYIQPIHWKRLIAWGAENEKPLITDALLGALSTNHPPNDGRYST